MPEKPVFVCQLIKVNLQKSDIHRITPRNSMEGTFGRRSGWLVISSWLTHAEPPIWTNLIQDLAEQNGAEPASTKTDPRQPPPPVYPQKATAHGWLVCLTLSDSSESQNLPRSPSVPCFGTIGMPNHGPKFDNWAVFWCVLKAAPIVDRTKVRTKDHTFSLLFLSSAIFNSLSYPLYKTIYLFFPAMKTNRENFGLWSQLWASCRY